MSCYTNYITNLLQEAYYDMLVKYRDELTRPIQEAMEFMRRIEKQLSMLTNDPVRIFNSGTFFPIPFFVCGYDFYDYNKIKQINFGYCRNAILFNHYQY